ncbi:methyltransferase [Bradyrhizobium sp. WYCCWR 13022]|uniref:methyltransferase n=1 Tax=unclassified Bradyrhizobium TaxID=2631580 RepID=UPI00263B383C|nr:methyltransferase [Bradyrhizobium sp. WYCCWR 13022]MDN4988472.1 methyltransferase [Bradyrhizobium sp. WYCCWR 13022]
MSDNTGSPPSILTLISGFVPARLVFLAAELGLADLIAGGTMTAEGLARRTGTHAPSLKRMLRALCAYGVFEETTPGVFALCPMGNQLRSDVPSSLRNFARFFPDQRSWKCLGEIEHTIRTGETGMSREFGIDSFEWLDQHPKEAAIFNAAMADNTKLVARSATAAYDFSASRVIMDVGGGNGTFLAAILRSAPAASGMLFDLPAGVRDADSILRNAGVANRCKVIAGDFFQSVPAGADLMVLKNVIHDWDDERVAAILTQCRAVASHETRLLLIERVMPDRMTTLVAHQRAAALDIRMLTITGGIERTEEEYRQLLGRTGFDCTRIIPLGPPSDQAILEAVLR